ncbi:hypothetical protein ACLKA7_001526 [Drosophila subpalustris]
MDETWIYHYIPKSNRSSAEWREAGESRSKRVKASRWAVPFVFCLKMGLSFGDYLSIGAKFLSSEHSLEI